MCGVVHRDDYIVRSGYSPVPDRTRTYTGYSSGTIKLKVCFEKIKENAN